MYLSQPYILDVKIFSRFFFCRIDYLQIANIDYWMNMEKRLVRKIKRNFLGWKNKEKYLRCLQFF